MAEVTITLNGRTYRLQCDDGEEEHLLALSHTVGERLDGLQKQFGQIGDERLLLMSVLMISDELNEAQKKLEVVEAERARAETRAVNQISAAAGRVELLYAALNDKALAREDK